ncbi:MAG: hypothetical protein ABIQ13_15765 [Pedococcus sp.]
MAAAQRPSVVGAELADAADSVTSAVSGVPGDQWMRRGLRSNGSVFTVESLGRHLLHDLAHHLVDVGEVNPSSAGRWWRQPPTVRAVDCAQSASTSRTCDLGGVVPRCAQSTSRTSWGAIPGTRSRGKPAGGRSVG